MMMVMMDDDDDGGDNVDIFRKHACDHPYCIPIIMHDNGFCNNLLITRDGIKIKLHKFSLELCL